MTITYQLTQKDFHDSFIAHRKSRPLTTWAIRAVLIFLAITALIDIWWFFTGHLEGSLFSALIPLFLLAVMWVLILWGTPHWTAKSQFTKQPSAQGPRTLTLDDAGVHWRWEGGSADIAWRNLIKYCDSKD